MSDRIHCLSSHDEPGLVRIVRQSRADSERHGTPCAAGETLDWSIAVEDGDAALAALHRSMRRYRKDRGGGIYRCTPRHAREIVARHAMRPGGGADLARMREAVQMGVFAVALLAGIFALQFIETEAAQGIGAMAAALVVSTLGLGLARDRYYR